jgi:hypothetical protein
MDLSSVQQQIDRLYAELATLNRVVLTYEASRPTSNRAAWEDLKEAAKEISAQWSGPTAVEEIRAQREK